MAVELVTRSSNGMAPTSMESWSVMREQASMLVKTGFLPDTIKTPEQAVAIMMKGRELGIPAMYSLSNIVVIKGKPTCSSELMLALLYRDHGDQALRIDTTTPTECKVSYKRHGWSEYRQYAFTLEDATRAGLAGGGTWKQYPAAMLRARCISAVARMAFPDSIGGMYTAEELGAEIVSRDGGDTFTVVDAHQVVEVPPAIADVQPADTPKPESLRERYARLLAATKAMGLEVIELPEGTKTSQAARWCDITEQVIAAETAARAAQAEPEAF